MDIATLGGIIGGFTLMVVALLLAGSHGTTHGVSLAQFVDPPAAIMVLGGGLAVVMTSVPLKKFLSLPKMCLKLVVNRGEDLGELVRTIVSLAEVARKDGLLALEGKLAELTSHSLVVGVQMAVDGTRPEVIREILTTEMKAEEARHHVGKRMFDIMGRCGPAFGMIATLLGLILMLGNLDDPDSIGPSMAMALVGTLYGAAMANMICMPCAEKLAYLSHQEQLAKQIVLDGVLAIQAGDSPRIIEQKLKAYLPASLAHASQEAA
ncbi:MAG TPA: MotA/TolQ/ExbB proton channel family protein [Pirellulales bacterium]|nr:MotA/TolQ/ExbB proton channel family protein [Pirellulales bacterium]